MKRFLIFLVCMLFLLSSPVFAKTNTVKVIALEHFSTEFPLSTYNVQTIEPEDLGNGVIIPSGTVIAGNVVRIEKPKRGKRNAYFEFIPTHMLQNGVVQKIEEPLFIARVVGYKPLDPNKVVFSVAKTTAGFFVKGVSQGISFVQGVTEAEEGDRLKSGITKMYKDSPLSFIEPGRELNVNIGDTLVLKLIKTKKN